MQFTVRAVPADEFARLGRATARKPGPALDPDGYIALAQQSQNVAAVHLPRGRAAACSTPSPLSRFRPDPAPQAERRCRAVRHGRSD